MSYFVIPEYVNAQAKSSTTGGTTSDTTKSTEITETTEDTSGENGEETEAADLCLQDFNQQNDAVKQVFSLGIILNAGIPPYSHQCFTMDSDGETIVHKFKYSLQGQDEDAIWEQKFTPARDTDPSLPKIYAGCYTGYLSANADYKRTGPCISQETPTAYNYFNFYDSNTSLDHEDLNLSLGDSTASNPGGSLKETYNEEVELYQFDTTLKTRPNAFLVVSKKYKLIYGFYAMNTERLKPEFSSLSAAKRNEERQKNFDSDDLEYIAPRKSYTGASALDHYIGQVNRNYGAAGRAAYVFAPLSPDFFASPQLKSAYTTIGVRNVFGTVTNSFNQDNVREKDLTLQDGNSGDPGDKPPVVIVSKKATGLPNDLTFTLEYLPYVSTTFDLFANAIQADNNYFFFALGSINDTEKESLALRGIDPELVYLVIDVGGNVGFVVEDTSKAGGIFLTDRKKIDEFIVIGPVANSVFSNEKQLSLNMIGEPLRINVDEYREVITQRVYNEPKVPEVSGKACDETQIINYPQVNKGYSDSANSSTFDNGIPKGTWRRCINLGSGGWLDIWGVKVRKLDSLKDPCVQAFEQKGNYWYNFFVGGPMGRTVCWVVGTATNAAVWLAGFSVDFFISAVGLQ